MRAAFYGAMSDQGYVTQKAFSDIILGRYVIENGLSTVDKHLRGAVIARARRAYPSFMRQYHFGYMLESEFEFILDNDQIDYNGFDYIVIDGGVAIGIELSVKTPRAEGWGVVKKTRNPRPKGINIVRISASRDKSNRIGKFWVHSESDINRIRQAKNKYLYGVINSYLSSAKHTASTDD